MKIYQFIVSLLICMMFWIHLTGCTGLVTKATIRKDLSNILKQGDCVDICTALKIYLATQMGGTIPIPSPSEPGGHPK
jgi:hypothetical protein